MLRVSDHFEQSDTGRSRRANEDSHYARAPLFVVADGMGGAQAGEVASRIAVEAFARGLPDEGPAESRLALRVAEANRAIHELSRADADRAGMGTTLTAAYVGEEDVAIAHVGDSRAYRWRDGALERLTDDHSLVEELVRQGKLTAEEADDHPQRSIITRALGPEPDVAIDTRTAPARDGDVFLLCSDGLTSMISEGRISGILADSPSLAAAGRALINAANEAGGRDNITVLLFRLEAVKLGSSDAPAVADPPTTEARAPRLREAVATPPKRRRWGARLGGALIVMTILGAIALGTYAAISSVYFLGTEPDGRVALFRGLPYELPLGIELYRTEYRTGVPASSLEPDRRDTLLDHQLRSHSDATDLVRQLELGQLQGT